VKNVFFTSMLETTPGGPDFSFKGREWYMEGVRHKHRWSTTRKSWQLACTSGANTCMTDGHRHELRLCCFGVVPVTSLDKGGGWR